MGPIILPELEGYLGVRFWGCAEAVLKAEENSPKEFSHLQIAFLGGIGGQGVKTLACLRTSSVRPLYLSNSLFQFNNYKQIVSHPFLELTSCIYSGDSILEGRLVSLSKWLVTFLDAQIPLIIYYTL